MFLLRIVELLSKIKVTPSLTFCSLLSTKNTRTSKIPIISRKTHRHNEAGDSNNKKTVTSLGGIIDLHVKRRAMKLPEDR